MALGTLTREYSYRKDGGAPRRGRGGVELELADYVGLDAGELVKLIFQADSAKRQLDGYLVGLLAAFGDLMGEDAVEDLCRQFGLGRRRAKRQAKTASGLKALPITMDAVEQGLITVEHAQVLGESHERAPMSTEQEIALTTLAIKQDLDLFKKTVAKEEDERQGDNGLTRQERQHQRRSAKLFDGDNDMVILHAELDRVAGERVKTALDGLSDRMFRHDYKTGNDRTHPQRQADALVALITQRPTKSGGGGSSEGGDSAGAGEGRGSESIDSGSEGGNPDAEMDPQATTLLVKVDYDTVCGQLQDAGLIDGTPIHIDELRRIACDASIIPAIFSADGQPLYLGRKQRSATPTQKLALQARDKQCIGCGLRASACDAHHIHWWENGGPTDITNLVLLCPKCHTKVHKQGYAVDTDCGGQFRLRPPPPHQALELLTGTRGSDGVPGEEGEGAFVVGVVFEGSHDGLAGCGLLAALPGGG